MKNDMEIFAYNKIERDYSKEYSELVISLRSLFNLTREIESPLLCELKPTIVLCIKWKFDYLSKTHESPFLLKSDIDYWISILEMLKKLSKQNWFKTLQLGDEQNIWKRTKEAFNFMWPRNTQGHDFDRSKEIAEKRLSQIISMMENGTEQITNKEIFDSGCGPGRYLDVLIQYNPLKCVGLDSGKEITEVTRKRFSSYSNVEIIRDDCASLPVDDNSFDFVLSNGVLHHLPNPMEELVKEHARIVRPGGYFFIFIAGKGGLELEIWKFMREFLYDIPVEVLFKRFSEKIISLRLQGLLDHSYGEYQQTNRTDLERWLSNSFSEIQRVPGIKGLDVTEEVFKDDLFFKYRFGCGNLRYLCRK